jgi:hypothetical protein
MAAIVRHGASLEEEKLKIVKADEALTEAYKVVQEMGRKARDARKDRKDDTGGRTGDKNGEEVEAEEEVAMDEN